jgi:hypothetical protein
MELTSNFMVLIAQTKAAHWMPPVGIHLPISLFGVLQDKPREASRAPCSPPLFLF